MCRFIESIRWEGGCYHLLDYHQARVDRTFQFHFPDVQPIRLADVLPDIKAREKHKVRVVYGPNLVSVGIERYVQRKINSISLVEVGDYDYRFKYEDRGQIEKWREDSGADEIIMTRNGYIADASYANVVLFDGEKWLTPQSCMLAGVQRTHLLAHGRIEEKALTVGDLSRYDSIGFINALLPLGQQVGKIIKLIC
jgi:4-amino-4-deoxychorismate lyase